jgi:hypothetical protein
MPPLCCASEAVPNGALYQFPLNSPHSPVRPSLLGRHARPFAFRLLHVALVLLLQLPTRAQPLPAMMLMLMFDVALYDP